MEQLGLSGATSEPSSPGNAGVFLRTHRVDRSLRLRDEASLQYAENDALAVPGCLGSLWRRSRVSVIQVAYFLVAAGRI